ncbi:hypothetical protein Hanom_Chr12g01127271 [Helianthus anomalus]
MCKKPVSYEWFSYICILSQIHRKSRVVTHFLRKMVSEILFFLVVKPTLELVKKQNCKLSWKSDFDLKP